MTYRYDDIDELRPVTPPATRPPPEPLEPATPGPRPALVTTAAGLMVVLTVYVLVIDGIILYTVLSISDTVTTSPEDARALTIFRIVVAVVCGGYFLVGLGVIALAVKVLRGWNWARITTFVVYGVFFVTASVGVLGLFSIEESFASMSGGVSWEEILESLAMLIILGSHMLIMVTTVALLALPVSGRWFKEWSAARRAGPPTTANV